jgi:hypothetical protein
LTIFRIEKPKLADTSRRDETVIKLANGCRRTRQNNVAMDSYQIAARAPKHGPNGGIADSLNAAKAAFREAWSDGRPQSGSEQFYR